VELPIQAFHLPMRITSRVGHPLRARGDRLGTLSGGWRIVKTMGNASRNSPVRRFAAGDEARDHALVASYFEIPVSTHAYDHRAITGVGAANRISRSAGMGAAIVWAWMLTIPASAGIGGLTYLLLRAVVYRAGVSVPTFSHVLRWVANPSRPRPEALAPP